MSFDSLWRPFRWRSDWWWLAVGALLSMPALAVTALDRGEVRFRGYVIDMAPKWRWQIASPPQRWSVDMADAKRSPTGWQFDLRDKAPLPFLEGHLWRLAERGGHDMVPRITFSSGDTPLTLLSGGHPAEQRFIAAIPVRHPDSGDVIGQLQFTVEQALAVAMAGQQEGYLPFSLVSGDTVETPHPHGLSAPLTQRLVSLFSLNEGLPAVGALDDRVLTQHPLQDPSVTRLGAAYASQLSDFSLHFPAQVAPARWQAQLNVSVTVD